MLPFRFQVIQVASHSLGAINGAQAGEYSPGPAAEDLDRLGRGRSLGRGGRRQTRQGRRGGAGGTDSAGGLRLALVGTGQRRGVVGGLGAVGEAHQRDGDQDDHRGAEHRPAEEERRMRGEAGDPVADAGEQAWAFCRGGCRRRGDGPVPPGGGRPVNDPMDFPSTTHKTLLLQPFFWKLGILLLRLLFLNVFLFQLRLV